MFSDSFKNVDFISKSPTVDEIKQLQTNEDIENISKLFDKILNNTCLDPSCSS